MSKLLGDWTQLLEIGCHVLASEQVAWRLDLIGPKLLPSGQVCWELGKGQWPAPHLVNQVPLTISDGSFPETFCCMGVGFWHPEICPALPLSPWIWKGELLRRLGREKGQCQGTVSY